MPVPQKRGVQPLRVVVPVRRDNPHRTSRESAVTDVAPLRGPQTTAGWHGNLKHPAGRSGASSEGDGKRRV
jgi:hypothetical protein